MITAAKSAAAQAGVLIHALAPLLPTSVSQAQALLLNHAIASQLTIAVIVALIMDIMADPHS